MTGITKWDTTRYRVEEEDQIQLDRFLNLVSIDSHLDVTINNDNNAKHYCLYRGLSVDNSNQVSRGKLN